MLTIPTIHLNGTSKDRLVDALATASDLIDDAYAALKQTAPNGRDYYPQGDAALGLATAEHMSRLKRLDEIKAEVGQLIQAIEDGGWRKQQPSEAGDE